MFSLAINNSIKRLHFYLGLLLTLFTLEVTPGANDLHFYDGSSTADIIAGDVFFEILDPPELSYTYRIRPAKDFGAPFNGSITFERARLVPTIPLHSCSDIINQDEIIGNIALSERGECSFVHKTFEAQRAGARAMIITESIDRWDEALDHLIEMVDDKCAPPYVSPKIAEIAISSNILSSERERQKPNSYRRLSRPAPVATAPPHARCSTVPANETNYRFRMDVDVHIPAAFLLGRSGVAVLSTLRRLRRTHAIVTLPVNVTHTPPGKMNQPPWISW